ncbi:alpha/beta hydrolase [Paracoccus sp. TOH]|uniref:alpha/beta hydrolase n=1 Tax=Paracoccus sp. TOH TaxID=1263728 RepID=UPI0025B22100|nr:alpha/beta hydrolase [Paracoccus sp. TOH]WJS84164.1 alpha/beta hydrolase [Paracoccus sp. TOH]
MSRTAAALADLRFGLKFAAKRYLGYADRIDTADNAGFYRQIAGERLEDAARLDQEAGQNDLAQEASTIGEETAGPLLGMGEGEPMSDASAAYRVQRAENTLDRMAAQLHSLLLDGPLRDVIHEVRARINQRREGVRAARRRAHLLEWNQLPGAAANGVQNLATDGHHVTVWFGTNRRLHTNGQFLGERADQVRYGRCAVFVPEDREAGSLGRGLFGRIFKGDNRVKLKERALLDETLFWKELVKEVTSLNVSERDGLVFLHGYNTKFVDVARRTAQLKVDLAHRGPAAFFSWPSLGYPAGYAGDEAAIEGSEQVIRDFLVNFAQRSGVSAVHIIAHSMGNRGLLRAMDAIAKIAASAAPVRFGQIILAAPDVDAQLFTNLAAAYGQISTRATLYVTANDKAIGLSRELHRFHRAGLAPPVAVVPGIDTIDASRVNLGLMGHSYAAEMRAVLADMHRLIQSDTAPDKRFGLRRALRGAAPYWEFVP